MPMLDLARCYCELPGQEPAEPVDWRGELDAAREAHPPTPLEDGSEDDGAYNEARAALDARRLATTSHIVRNGRGVRVGDVALLPPLDVELVGVPDELGGYELRSHGRLVQCPECGARVRMIED